MGRYIIGIDQSTQGTKALLVDEGGHLIHRADRSHRQIVNEAGWVSHDPAEIAANVLAAARAVVEETGVDPADIAGIGISNQRETTVAWDRATGQPVCDAIVWQCARARSVCEAVASADGAAELVRGVTGLALSPYYPAAKMAWILEHVPGAAALAAQGDLCLGTIDSWVVWTLTGGHTFACDYSNASRTQLFDLEKLAWSDEVCALFGVDAACLPEVRDSDACFGETDLGGFLPAPVPIHGALGDSHAALFGQGCLSRGMAKATLGTGSSVMMNVGPELVRSSCGLSSSLAWRMSGEASYVLEGNINYAGAVKTWLRDDMGLVATPDEVTELCYAANPASHVYLVPAFTGLGAPHWASDAEAAVFGMTRTTGRAEFVRAADESIAYQIFDVADAMRRDSGLALSELRVDGGPTRDGYLMQFLTDLLETPLRAAGNDEMSGLGAAWCCGIALGMYGPEVTSATPPRATWDSAMAAEERAEKVAGWHHAVEVAIAYE